MKSQSDVSSSIEECLRLLAKRHLDIRFIRLHYLDAEMEPAGVPALLAYRGGDKFAGLVPIIDEIPDDADLSASTLEHMLQKYDCLSKICNSCTCADQLFQTPNPPVTMTMGITLQR